MYARINQKTGIASVADKMAAFKFESTPDGLSFLTGKPTIAGAALGCSGRLYDWLAGLRLLRNVPLAYLVPDPALLPPESMRFFHVDHNWIERVIDGVFAAANVGTVAATFTYDILRGARVMLDNAVNSAGWSYGKDPMTGLLIRSELVRRWPDMIVEAFSTDNPVVKVPIPVLRCEPISPGILIALFAGSPASVRITEPHVGVRFGVEKAPPGSVPDPIPATAAAIAAAKAEAAAAKAFGGATKASPPTPAVPSAPGVPPYQLDFRSVHGETPKDAKPLLFGFPDKRVVPISDIKRLIDKRLAADDGPALSRMIGLHLEQRPFQQVFRGANENSGSKLPYDVKAPDKDLDDLPLQRRGVLRLDRLKARLAKEMEGK